MKLFSQRLILFFRLIRMGNHASVITVLLAYIAGKNYVLTSSDALPLLTLLIMFGPLTNGVIYLFNDLSDYKYDILHPEKSKGRVIASGEVTIKTAKIVLMCLLTVSLVCGYLISSQIFYLQLGFLSLGFLYTKVLKKVPYVDILTNATSHMLRSLAGVVVAGANVFLFLPLLITHFLMAGYASTRRRQRELIYASQDVRPTLKYYSINKLRLISAVFILKAGVYQFFSLDSPAFTLQLLYLLFPLAVYALDKSHNKIKNLMDYWYYGNASKITVEKAT